MFHMLLIVIILFVNTSTVKAMEIQGEGAFLIELNTDKILYDKKANKKMYPASTTKIMTALLAIEHGDLQDIIEVGKEVEGIPSYSNKAGLFVGQKISLGELLYGLMLPSGNDAAKAIAVHFAQEISPKDTLNENEAISEFAKLMNSKAKELGANDTHFVNPHGFHDENHYTTPRDMAIITKEALKSEFFRKIVSTFSHSHDNDIISQGEKEASKWFNTNALIDPESDYYNSKVNGVKTGTTLAAGRCLVTSATNGNLDLLSVVFKSATKDDLWNDSNKLISFGFDNYKLHTITKKNQTITKVKVDNASKKNLREINIIVKEDIKTLIKKEDIDKIKQEINIDKKNISENIPSSEILSLRAPLKKEETLGNVIYSLNDTTLGEAKVYAEYDVKRRNVLNTYWGFVIPIFLIALIFFVKNKKSGHK